MKSKTTRLSAATAVLAGIVAAVLPFGSAGAQWGFLARKEMNKHCEVGG